MNNKYKNKFIFSLQYYVENNGIPYIYLPPDYFVTPKDKAFRKSASYWIPNLLAKYLGRTEILGGAE